MPTARNTPFVLIIRDGWGENPNPEHDSFNAVKLAKTPVDDALRRDWPMTLIHTSGEDVGLVRGTMGNSEVGHQNIGAGRVVDQEAVRISRACSIDDGLGLLKNDVIREAVAQTRECSRPNGDPAALHLLSIASDAGVHGLIEHLLAVVRAANRLGAERVHVHLFTDGRDTGPFTGLGFVELIESELKKIGSGAVASIIGRYWGMDRDHRWERVAWAYDCLTGGNGSGRKVPTAATAAEAIRAAYDKPISDTQKGDEFIPPTAIGASGLAATSRIHDNDAVIFCNYRGDRPRELVSAFVLPEAQWRDVKASPESGVRGFDRGQPLRLHFVTMTSYSESLAPHVRVAFPKPPKMRNIAGEYPSSLGLTQLRCAETEKYPHVTFFFNDYRDEPFEGEFRVNPQSPKVATYDTAPEMAAEEVCESVITRLRSESPPDFTVVNFANGDMVGHTGSLEAAVKACEKVDECVGKIVEATLERCGCLIVTADHGNAEQMWDPDNNSPHTAHTTYDVPLFVIGDSFKGRALRDGGRLADVIPTALEMIGLAQPEEMTGRSLLPSS